MVSINKIYKKGGYDMRTKKFFKKLALKKETIAHLENNDMKNIQGAAPLTVVTDCKCIPTISTYASPECFCRTNEVTVCIC